MQLIPYFIKNSIKTPKKYNTGEERNTNSKLTETLNNNNA